MSIEYNGCFSFFFLFLYVSRINILTVSNKTFETKTIKFFYLNETKNYNFYGEEGEAERNNEV